MNTFITCLIMVATSCNMHFANFEQREVRGRVLEDNISWLRVDFSKAENLPCERQREISREDWVPRNACDTSKLPKVKLGVSDAQLDAMMEQLEPHVVRKAKGMYRF